MPVSVAVQRPGRQSGSADRTSVRNPPTLPGRKKHSSAASPTTSVTNPVVASLPKKSPHPYSSLALSPDRTHAVTASKDTIQILRVGADGLSLLQTIPIAQHFQTATTGDHRAMGRIHEDVRDSFASFGLGSKTAAAPQPNLAMNVVITSVAWSPQPTKGVPPTTASVYTHTEDASKNGASDKGEQTPLGANTFLAVAGSNGVIVVWNADALLQGSGHATPHEVVLNPHNRAVNRLAWHPTRLLLLSASQDGTVKLWERRKQSKPPQAQGRRESKQFSLFRSMNTTSASVQTYSWYCRLNFEPKSEAVRDIAWSPFYDDVFALVTTSGSLVAYNMHLPKPAMLKMTAHAGDATSIDWHPTKPNILATGGASDRCVKIWDLVSYLSLNKDENNLAANYETVTSRADSVNTDASSDTERGSHTVSFGLTSLFPTVPRLTGTLGSSANLDRSRHKSQTDKAMLHVLYISASVTRLRWRLPANDKFLLEDEDRHSSMLAVATAPIKGASAGFPGLLGLWSFHRPFMPLSVVEGHREGAVMDFDWLDTPQPKQNDTGRSLSTARMLSTIDLKGDKRGGSSRLQGSTNEADSTRDTGEADEYDKPIGIWQHVISVGRDGRCLLQSFVRGDRPISRVPPSCFAMANLSPFQRGYGSLQVFSVCQQIPSGPRENFLVTGLRNDSITAQAPGVFRELPSETSVDPAAFLLRNHWMSKKSMPSETPTLVFNVLDQGELDHEAKPVGQSQQALTIAPEVVHLSRFAESYVLYPSESFPTRKALCVENGEIAMSLNCGPLAHMWRLLASMLESALLDGLPEKGSEPGNIMQFVLLPTIKGILEERADAGDVQSCVALCEVLDVLTPDQTTRVPGLELNLVREWYLSYIDLLRDMCLFSHASLLIRSCKDPFIGALNQQSTIIYESCPSCGKPLQSSESGGASTLDGTVRRACKSCRRRIGMCFLCHEPVKGMYVWCPGCGKNHSSSFATWASRC
jgi:WD40 repeat protein